MAHITHRYTYHVLDGTYGRLSGRSGEGHQVEVVRAPGGPPHRRGQQDRSGWGCCHGALVVGDESTTEPL